MYRHKITPEGEQVVAGDDVATTYVKDALDANFDYSNGHTNFGPPDEGSSEGDSDSSREVDMRAVIGKRMMNASCMHVPCVYDMWEWSCG